MPKYKTPKDLTGLVFGRWTVLGRGKPPQNWKHQRTFWLCRCDCGTVRSVFRNGLTSGNSKSCGCLRTENIPKGKDRPQYKHGQAGEGKRTKEWRAWNGMIRRVKYPSMNCYPRYGGRGIEVCQEWLTSFETFFEDVGLAPSPELTLDRIDNNGNYEPDNVRWTTMSEQVKNSSHARMLTCGDRTMNLCDWVEETGIKRTTIQMRLDKYGWSVEKALTTPPQQRKK